MDVMVDLEVLGLDLADERVLETAADQLDDLAWSRVSGVALATLIVEAGTDPVCAAVDAGHRLQNVFDLPVRVHEDLVSASDIAQRVGVSREAVRLWGHSKAANPFPPPRGSVGGGERGATRIWAWSDVVDWLGSVKKLSFDERPLTALQALQVNHHLAQMPTATDHAWKAAQEPKEEILSVYRGLWPRKATVIGAHSWAHGNAIEEDRLFAQFVIL